MQLFLQRYVGISQGHECEGESERASCLFQKFVDEFLEIGCI